MRFVALLLTVLTSFAAARNSGIFNDGGQVVQPAGAPPIPRSLKGANLDGTAPPPQALPVPKAVRETNGYRMSRGLPPLPPARKRAGSDALYPRASCGPLVSNTGVVAVRKLSDNSLLGYISKDFDGQNSYTYAPRANALTVSLPSSPFGAAFDLTAVNGPSPDFPLVGAVGGSAGYNFNPNNIGYSYLAGTGHTAANSPPSSTAGHSIQSLGYNAPAESQIWTLDCLSLKFSAQWTNVDGSQPPTSFFYDPSVDFLGLVGDFAKFASTFPGEGAYLVSLTYVPTP